MALDLMDERIHFLVRRKSVFVNGNHAGMPGQDVKGVSAFFNPLDHGPVEQRLGSQLPDPKSLGSRLHLDEERLGDPVSSCGRRRGGDF